MEVQSGMIALIVFASLFAVWLVFYFIPVGLWFSALVSGVLISLLQLILMRWRKVPPSTIVSSMIESTKAGLNLDPNELEAGIMDPNMLKELMEAAQEASMAGQQGQVDKEIDQLYEQLKSLVDASGANIEITKGDGYVFLSLVDTVFFYPDQYVMLPEGRELLNQIAPILKAAAPSIDEIRISGHTAQGQNDAENDPEGDRMLSAQRAAQVSYYLQQLCRPKDSSDQGLDPARIVGQSFGQWRPIAANDDENRRRNRRVEMTITGKDLGSKLGDALEQYYTQREGGSLKEDESSAPAESAGAADQSGQEG